MSAEWIEFAKNVAANGLWSLIGLTVGYLAGRYRFHSQLSGRWQGELEPVEHTLAEFKSHVIKCELIVIKQNGKQNCGFLYYDRECEKQGTVSRGVDALTDYRRVYMRLGSPPEFTLEFTRKIHHPIKGEPDESLRRGRYECRFDSLLFWQPQRIHVRTAIVNGTQSDPWEGVLVRAS